MDYTTLPYTYDVRNGRYRVGDHLFFNRAFGVDILSHHGVYVGNKTVVHFYPTLREGDEQHVSGNERLGKEGAKVQAITLSDFKRLARKRGSRVMVVDHDVRLPREETVERCRAELGATGYNAIHNNCEHFVNFAVLGSRHSEQSDAMRAQLRELFG